MATFKVGDKVRARANYRDESLGERAPWTIQEIREVLDVRHMQWTSGQWVKTDLEEEWVDSGWFEAVDDDVSGTRPTRDER